MLAPCLMMVVAASALRACGHPRTGILRKHVMLALMTPVSFLLAAALPGTPALMAKVLAVASLGLMPLLLSHAHHLADSALRKQLLPGETDWDPSLTPLVAARTWMQDHRFYACGVGLTLLVFERQLVTGPWGHHWPTAILASGILALGLWTIRIHVSLTEP